MRVTGKHITPVDSAGKFIEVWQFLLRPSLLYNINNYIA